MVLPRRSAEERIAMPDTVQPSSNSPSTNMAVAYSIVEQSRISRGGAAEPIEEAWLVARVYSILNSAHDPGSEMAKKK